MKDEASIEPGWGNRFLFCLARELPAVVTVSEQQWDMIRVTHPFFTPSICKSTHHTPATRRIVHRPAFLPPEPIGSQASRRKYATVVTRTIGRRHVRMRRRMKKGSEDESTDTGRNGAIPEPGRSALSAEVVGRPKQVETA